MGKLASVRRRVDGIVDCLAAVMFLIIFLTVLIQILFRYALNSPLVWSEELSRAVFIWVCMFGWALAARNGSHIRITFISDRLPPLPGKILRILFGIVGIAFLCALGAFGAVMAHRTMGRTLITVNWIPIGLIYLSLPAAALPCVFYGIFDLFVPGAGNAPAAIE